MSSEVEVRPEAPNDRAAEVMLRMELRRAVAQAEEAEAAAEQIDTRQAVNELRSRLGRLLARRQRIHEAELAEARARVEDEIAAARRRAEDILVARSNEPIDDQEPAGEPFVTSTPALTSVSTAVDDALVDDALADDAPADEGAGGLAQADVTEPDAVVDDDEPIDEFVPADEPDPLVGSNDAVDVEVDVDVADVSVDPGATPDLNRATPEPDASAQVEETTNRERQAALTSLVVSLSTPRRPASPPAIPPPHVAPSARRLPLRAGSALPAPLAVNVVALAPTASPTDTIAIALSESVTADDVEAVRIDQVPTEEPARQIGPATTPIVGLAEEQVDAVAWAADQPLDEDAAVWGEDASAVDEAVMASVEVGTVDELTIMPLDIEPVAIGAFLVDVDHEEIETEPRSAALATIDAEVLAAALAKALAPLIGQRHAEPPSGYYRVVEPPAKQSVWSTAKHVDVALLAVALVIVIGILASWMV